MNTTQYHTSTPSAETPLLKARDCSGEQHTQPPPEPSDSSRSKLGRALKAGLMIIPIALAVGFVPQWRARRAVAEETRVLAVPTVNVVSPEPHQAFVGVPLPAEIRAFAEAPIYARANGYLKRWFVDIGTRVNAGQLLAEIDTPEVDQDLAQRRAEVAQAEAALELARTTAVRWTDLLKTASVSAQETTEKQADLALKLATLDGARANVRRLEELKSFGRVTAPFDGTITARRTDVGQLVAAGNGQELFRLAQTSTLRVFVRVPQALSRNIAPGQGAELTQAELPGRKFEAKVVRTAGAMEPDSRTLLTELEMNNEHGDILAGSYAQVRFTDTPITGVLSLPSNTLLFRSDGMEVGVVGPNSTVELRSVKLGRDFGQIVEIVEGVSTTDRVILNPSDSLAGGATVRVAAPSKKLAAAR